MVGRRRDRHWRRGCCWNVYAVAWLAAACWLAGTGEARAEAAYPDVEGHWAQRYIDVLADEGVTQGFRVFVYNRRDGWHFETWFYPDRDMKGDEWTVLAARVFALPTRPVSWEHYLDGGQEVAEWLDAAARAGWQLPASQSGLRRVDAITMLIQALDLWTYAQELPASTVAAALGRYRDAGSVPGHARRAVAAATLLGIAEGYPDGSFRPDRKLTRAEGATLLARSALARADAQPNPFYPDGDGIEDYTVFSLTTLRNRNTWRWHLEVQASAGTPLWWTGSDAGWPPTPPAQLAWYGTGSTGATLPPGEYFYRFSIWDSAGQRWDSARKPIRLGWRRLQGGLSPDVVGPGDPLTVWAVTLGDATGVTARLEDGPPVALLPDGPPADSRRWDGILQVPAATPPGPRAVHLTAAFPGTTRHLTLTFLVRDPVHLTAGLEPTALPAGGRVRVWAETSANVTAVEAIFADGTRRSLTRSQTSHDPAHWETTRIIPPDTPEGPQPVTVRAESTHGPRQVVLWLEITGDVRQRLQTILSD